MAMGGRWLADQRGSHDVTAERQSANYTGKEDVRPARSRSNTPEIARVLLRAGRMEVPGLRVAPTLVNRVRTDRVTNTPDV